MKMQKYHQVNVLIAEVDKYGALLKPTNVSHVIGSKLSPVPEKCNGATLVC
jgi:hypothetical protein